MNADYVIYGLSSSLNVDEIRYIGITKKPANRLSNHKYYSTKKTNKRANWVKKVLQGGNQLILTILEDGLTTEDAKKKEIEYILLFKSFGANLVNLTSGGDGVNNYVPSSETKQKQREAKLKNPTRYWLGKKRGKINGFGEGRPLGVPLTDEHKDKIRHKALGRKMSQDAIDKIRKSKTGIPSKARKNFKVTNVITGESYVLDGVGRVAESIGTTKPSLSKYFTRKSTHPFLGKYIFENLSK